MKEKNIEVINRLKYEYPLPEEIAPALDILLKHADRIRFVKDVRGLRNYLFISTVPQDEELFDYPYLLVTSQKKRNKKRFSKTIVIRKANDIIASLDRFFKTRTDTLFVAIGFKESVLSNWEYMQLLNLMEETKRDVSEILLTFNPFNKFPEWYSKTAEFPFYIFKERLLLKDLRINEKAFLLQKKQDLFKEMNTAVKNNDRKEFENLRTRLITINNQLKELDDAKP